MMEYTELCRRCVDMNALVSWKVHSSTDMVFRILNSIPMHFSEENNTKFEKLFSEIYKNVDLWHETIIRDYVISVIEKIHNGIDIYKDGDAKQQWKNFSEKTPQEYTVGFPVYGLILDKSIQVGPFTLYSKQDFIEYLQGLSKAARNAMEESAEKNKSLYWITKKVKANSGQRAQELSRPYFELFEHVARFFLQDTTRHDIGIFKFKSWEIRYGCAFSVDDGFQQIYAQGASRPIQASELIAKSGNKQIWEIVGRYCDDREKKTKQKKCTEMETRLINAIIWIGSANYENSEVNKYIQYVFAIEGLLAYKPKGTIITPSIAHQLAEWAAFIIGEDAKIDVISKEELRVKMYSAMKKVYDKRSRIVHGNDNDIKASDMVRVSEVAYCLVGSILNNRDVLSASSMEQIQKWVDLRKFGEKLK